MLISKKRSMAALVSAVSLMAATASAASAAPAHWVTTGGAWLAGSNVTLTLNNAQPKSCSSFAFIGNAFNSGSTGNFTSNYPATLTCPGGGTLAIQPNAVASVTGGAYSLAFTGQAHPFLDTLWSATTSSAIAFTVPFTNGSPSTITFNNTPIARQATGGIIRLTGTLQTQGTALTLAP